jgi:glycosyltransferase involved in cell wall biosynthesis
LNLVYVFFDLPYQPYCGFEYRVAELLCETDLKVLAIPRHRTLSEGRLGIPDDVDAAMCSNPMALDVALEVKKILHKPLILQFLDVPKALFGSDEWRVKEYELVKERSKEADYITAISQTTANDVEAWLGRKVDFVNLLGVDTDVYDAFKPSQADYICGVVRGLAKQKRHEEIIKAVESSKTKPKLNLIFGAQSDAEKAKIMSKSLMGLGMSTLEGFGIYTCEFAYYQKPFICRKLPVFEEIWGNKLVYVETPEQMADKIDSLIGDPAARNTIGTTLYNHIIEKRLFLSEHAKRLETFLKGIH